MRSIGTSYLIRQTPGSERVGGLRVTLRRRSGEVGTLTVETTDWRTEAAIEHSRQLDACVVEALRGVREVGDQYGIPMDEFDVVLSHFIYHHTDSAPLCYYQAGKSAFRSALEAWRTRDLSANNVK
jgi:hypothetical protein